MRDYQRMMCKIDSYQHYNYSITDKSFLSPDYRSARQDSPLEGGNPFLPEFLFLSVMFPRACPAIA